VVLITVLGGVSGAYFNPPVSLVMAWLGALPWAQLPGYVAAQLLGGIAGTLAAHLMFELPVLQQGLAERAGPGQWLGEALATFGLLLTILGGLRWRPDAIAMLVGLYITAAYWFTSSTSFANPAVTVARALSNTFAGIRPYDVPAFIVAQLVGALLAAALAGWLYGQPRPAGQLTSTAP